LTPYKVLATKHDPNEPTKDNGILQMVLNSIPVQKVLTGKDFLSFNKYFEKNYQNMKGDKKSFHEYMDSVMDNFVKSCGNLLSSFL
jgi:hypothetical protein